MQVLRFLSLFLGISSVAARISKRNATTPNLNVQKLWDLQTNLLDNFLYPNSTVQAKEINSTLLASDIQGRVDITRTFDGAELNTEYLFGLFSNLAANANSFSLLGLPLSYEIIHFTANEYITAANTRFMFNFTSLGIMLPVEIDGWFTWNEAGQVTQYDVTFKYWEWLLDTVVTAAAQLLNTTTAAATQTALTEGLAQSICATSTQYCNGTNLQYANSTQCYEYLTEEVRFGEAYELGRNTLLCRMVHQNMVPFRPEVHCPHIGPTGGGYCTDDTTYVGTVENNYFNLPFMPSDLIS
ncbi:uncharacterized protein LY89DRAFT_686477 [Mollisia scopiformis]|uniref:Uncharacterized protein n=1 Tax=Mollisia scopiformis TaxID=149040 RepID=A0A194X462_MOLSC|nr:uncharacterized protein LY89DRAFT_686477 [Mollisia scopiformis]KUJ14844.1 hypothetical protein LY89DRAFT_686477 [Mollisia scopiformis]